MSLYGEKQMYLTFVLKKHGSAVLQSHVLLHYSLFVAIRKYHTFGA